eukprot:6224110-Prymnesium_polylepis.1
MARNDDEQRMVMRWFKDAVAAGPVRVSMLPKLTFDAASNETRLHRQEVYTRVVKPIGLQHFIREYCGDTISCQETEMGVHEVSLRRPSRHLIASESSTPRPPPRPRPRPPPGPPPPNAFAPPP